MLILPLISFLFSPGTPYVLDRPFAVDLRCMHSMNPQRLNPQGMSTAEYECRDGKWSPRVPAAAPVPDDKCTRYNFAGLITEGSVCDRKTGKIRAWNPPAAWPYPVKRTCTQIALTPDARCDPWTGAVTSLDPAERDRMLNFCNQPASGCLIVTDSTDQKKDTEAPFDRREVILENEMDRRDESARRAIEADAAAREAERARQDAQKQADEARTKADDEAAKQKADSAGQKTPPAPPSQGQAATPAGQKVPPRSAQQAYLDAQARLKAAVQYADDAIKQAKLARVQSDTDAATAENHLKTADARLAPVLAKLQFTAVPGGGASGTEEEYTVGIRLDQRNPLVLYQRRYPGDVGQLNSRSPVAPTGPGQNGKPPEATLMLPELADALHVLAMRVRLYNPQWTLKIDESYVQDLKGPLSGGQVITDELRAFFGNRHPDGRSADVSIVSHGAVLNDSGTQGILAGLAASVGFSYARNDVSSDPTSNRVYLSINWPARWIAYRDSRYLDPDTQRMLRARAGIPEPTFGKPAVIIRPPAPKFPAQVPGGLTPVPVLLPPKSP